MTGMPHPLDLLAQAVNVAGNSLHAASGVRPTSPTPCSEWDLGTLVFHVADSAATLRELIAGDAPGPPPAAGCVPAQRELRRLAQAVHDAPRQDPAVELIALTGSFELTIHAWDINQATGSTERLPADLVSTLLTFAPVVLNDIDHAGLFATSRPPTASQCTDTEQLLALFGRGPRNGVT
jgi:uncharacterized protein (TIGR03083 family)